MELPVASIDKEKFFELEYSYLRSEIQNIRSRLIRIASGTTLLVPGIISISKELNIGLMIVSLPLFIVAMSILYYAEGRAIMRIGSYIKSRYEIKNDISGWETWLSSKRVDDRRFVDKAIHKYFTMILALYYVFSCIAGSNYIEREKINISDYVSSVPASWTFYLLYIFYVIVAVYGVLLWVENKDALTDTN